MATAHNDQISLLAEVLGVALPQAYKEFLREGRHQSGSRWTILGLPLTSGVDSAWGATEFVWKARPDLNRQAIALQFSGADALCLDIRDSANPNPPVLLVSLKGTASPEVVGSSLGEVLNDAPAGDFLEQGVTPSISLPAREGVDAMAARLDLDFPDGLRRLLGSPPPAGLEHLVYRIDAAPARPPSVFWALATMRSGAQQPPTNLVPIMPVDERSFACTVCARRGARRTAEFGQVVRWHLEDVPSRGQQRLLDTSTDEYIRSIAAELHGRNIGIARIREIAVRYHGTHGSKDKLPRAHEERPIRLAVQNVIVGLAAIRHNSTYDALSARVWQTCQVPHVNAHEGCRGLASMTLSEAFRAGGTMEIRFDQHPERSVPASLRQYARTRGITLGQTDPRAIAPDEARELFLAVTQMPDGLARRVSRLTAAGILSVERACFVLASGIWRAIELDFILGTSLRAPSILRGGADLFDRPARQAELSACQAALMVGMLFARLGRATTETASTARVVEDERRPVSWTILEDVGGVRFDGAPPGPVPWQFGMEPLLLQEGQPFIVFPRPFAGAAAFAVAGGAEHAGGALVVVLRPRGSAEDDVALPQATVGQLVCPDGLEELSHAADARLLSCRVGRI